MKQLLLDVVAAPEPSLANFVPGPNTEALAALRALRPGRALYLWGPAGSGRTHLLRAFCAAGEACYLDADTPLAAFEQAAQGEQDPAPRRIAVDDVHRLDDARQRYLFALYNRWRDSSAANVALALVVAGNRAPAAMPLREDLRTRLGWDLVCRLDALSDADKIAALAGQAAARGLTLSPEVSNWILTHYERDMRRLTSLLDALDHYSLQTRRAITVPLLRTMLADPTAALASPSRP